MFEFESLILSWYFLLFTMPKLVLFFWIELIFLCLITGDQFFCHLSQNDNMYVSKKIVYVSQERILFCKFSLSGNWQMIYFSM